MKQSIIDWWDSKEASEKVSIWNEYCEEVNNLDGQIFVFDYDFFDTFFESKMDAVRAWHFGSSDNSWNDEYITFNGYGNLVTIGDYQVDEHIYLSDMEDFVSSEYESEIEEYEEIIEED